MLKTIQCPNCDAINLEEDEFCAACGEELNIKNQYEKKEIKIWI